MCISCCTNIISPATLADCVVPQEYGISIEEKRDIGSKMCHTLLEKINYDLAIARKDNQVDMRYLINKYKLTSITILVVHIIQRHFSVLAS